MPRDNFEERLRALNEEIADLVQVIGNRELEVRHHDIQSVINQEAIRCLTVYTTELLQKLNRLGDAVPKASEGL